MTAVMEPAVLAAAAAPPVRPPRPLGTATALWALSAFAVLCVWFAAYCLVLGAALESGSQERLYDRFREQLAQATAPLSVTANGRPVALIDAPHGGLHDVVVVEGTRTKDLAAGPGHRRDTVLPGQAGVSVVYGKGATYGAPFRGISGLVVGDRITVTTGQGRASYTVVGSRRAGDPLPAVPAAGAGRLTLVTSVGAGWRAGWAPDEVLYVDASLAKAQPAGTRAVVSAAEKAMGTSTEGLLPLVFWLQLLFAVVVGGVWAAARWGRWHSWLVVSPVLVAALVGASGAGAQLLPNLL